MPAADADIEAVCEEIAGLLDTVDGLKGRAHDLTPGEMLNPPYACVMDVAPVYNRTFGAGMTGLTVRVKLDVGVGPSLKTPQMQLRRFLANTGPGSVRAALEDHDGYEAFDDLAVVDFAPVGFEDVAELGFYGGVFTVDILI